MEGLPKRPKTSADSKRISVKYKKLHNKWEWTTKRCSKKLKTPPSSIFAEEILDSKVFKNPKKSNCEVDKLLYNLVNLAENKSLFNNNKASTRADYVEKREIDLSTLYSFDGPFQLLHADVGNLEFLGKNATFPQYVLVIVDLYSSKVYTYSMKFRKQILQEMKLFYD